MSYILNFYETCEKGDFVELRSVKVESWTDADLSKGIPALIEVDQIGWPKGKIAWEKFFSETRGNMPIKLVILDLIENDKIESSIVLFRAKDEIYNKNK